MGEPLFLAGTLGRTTVFQRGRLGEFGQRAVLAPWTCGRTVVLAERAHKDPWIWAIYGHLNPYFSTRTPRRIAILSTDA